LAGFVDLHSHVLYALDDGSRSRQESVDLLRGLRELGFDRVVATPHARPGLWDPSNEEVEGRLEDLRPEAETLGIELGVGAEHYYGERLVEADGARLRPHAGGPAVLLEVPTHGTPPGLEEVCFRLRVKGFMPLLAHPERYGDLVKDRKRVTALAGQAAFVLDLGSLGGSDGFWVKRAARKLLEQGLVSAVASDVHRPEELDEVRRGMDWIRRKLGEPALERLAGHNPRELLAGRFPELTASA
jgi:protein-tyrosine phosphatase